MRSHLSLNQEVAAACAAACAATMLSGSCLAQPFVAADYATNSTYATGWNAGQNGGRGFGPWSFRTDPITDGVTRQNAMDRTSPYDPFGVAWTLYNPIGPAIGCPNPPDTGTGPPSGDVARAGRAMPNGGLKPGQTFSSIIANPVELRYYRGYTIVLSTGGDNIVYGGAGTALGVGMFYYLMPIGHWWYTSQTYSSGGTPIFDTDTTTNGMQLDVTLTSATNYHLVMTPLGNPAIAYSEDGIITNVPPVITWVTYQLYNTDSDFYNFTNGIPSPCASPQRTDFYIKSMTVSGLQLNIQRVGSNVILSWPSVFTNYFTLVSSTNIGAAAVWNPVPQLPTVVDSENVVTNPIAASRQFYRLQQ